MKLNFIILIIYFITSCGYYNKSNIKGCSEAVTKDTFTSHDIYQKDYLEDSIIVIASYAAIECGCPQWFETKYKHVKFLEGVERFYLEPTSKNLTIANDLWDGEHLPLTVRVTGRFSKEKELPRSYHTKTIPEKARIFWYNEITILQ